MEWKIVVPMAGVLVLLVTIIIVATVPETSTKLYTPRGVKRILEALNDTETRILAEFDDPVNQTETDESKKNTTNTEDAEFCPVFSSDPAYENLVNVAYDKDTLGTPSYRHDLIGSRHHLGVDCNTTTYHHSITEHYPWWSVDLGTKYLIQAIRVLPGQHSGEHLKRFKDIKVSIGMENPTNRYLSEYTQVGTYAGPYSRSEGWVEFNLDMKISGRYVDIARTTITNDDYIILAEVEVLVDRRDLPGHIPHSECERRIDELTDNFLKSSSETKQQIEELINMVDILMKSSKENDCVAPFNIIPDVGCLYLSPNSGGWQEGKAVCEALGSSLFAANSTEQFLTLKRLYASNKPSDLDIWVGVKNGTWLNGRVPNSKEWAPGRPRGGWGPCGYIESLYGSGRGSPTYLLRDHPCAGNAHSLCWKEDI